MKRPNQRDGMQGGSEGNAYISFGCYSKKGGAKEPNQRDASIQGRLDMRR